MNQDPVEHVVHTVNATMERYTTSPLSYIHDRVPVAEEVIYDEYYTTYAGKHVQRFAEDPQCDTTILQTSLQCFLNRAEAKETYHRTYSSARQYVQEAQTLVHKKARPCILPTDTVMDRWYQQYIFEQLQHCQNTLDRVRHHGVRHVRAPLSVVRIQYRHTTTPYAVDYTDISKLNTDLNDALHTVKFENDWYAEVFGYASLSEALEEPYVAFLLQQYTVHDIATFYRNHLQHVHDMIDDVVFGIETSIQAEHMESPLSHDDEEQSSALQSTITRHIHYLEDLAQQYTMRTIFQPLLDLDALARDLPLDWVVLPQIDLDTLRHDLKMMLQHVERPW